MHPAWDAWPPLPFGSQRSLKNLTVPPVSTHPWSLCHLTGLTQAPRVHSPGSPCRLTPVPVASHLIGRQAAPVLDLRVFNLYSKIFNGFLSITLKAPWDP